MKKDYEIIENNILDIILLDDVVMSIDMDHRITFCKLLNEIFPNKQFIITTHDFIWRKDTEFSITENSINKNILSIISFVLLLVSDNPLSCSSLSSNFLFVAINILLDTSVNGEIG